MKEHEFLHSPVHEQPWRTILMALPKRVVGLISKIIGVKMFMFGVATALLIHDGSTFPWYAWIIVYVATMFGWDGLKWIETIRK